MRQRSLSLISLAAIVCAVYALPAHAGAAYGDTQLYAAGETPSSSEIGSILFGAPSGMSETRGIVMKQPAVIGETSAPVMQMAPQAAPAPAPAMQYTSATVAPSAPAPATMQMASMSVAAPAPVAAPEAAPEAPAAAPAPQPQPEAAAPAPQPEPQAAPASVKPASYQPAPEAKAKPHAIAFNIEFGFNSAVLPQDYYDQLEVLADALKSPEAKGRTVMIIGHTDTIGSAEYNEKLSLRRAEATRQVLIKRFGVPSARLASLGRGMDEPLDGLPGSAPENRRVEFKTLD